MGTTLIAIDDDQKRYIEEHPKYFLDSIKEMYSVSVQEQKKSGKGIVVFPQISNQKSSLYLLKENEVTEMNPDSAETLNLIKKNPEYVKTAIGFMKKEISRLERMFAESEEHKKD